MRSPLCEELPLLVVNLQLRAEGTAPVWQEGRRVNKTGGKKGGTHFIFANLFYFFL